MQAKRSTLAHGSETKPNLGLQGGLFIITIYYHGTVCKSTQPLQQVADLQLVLDSGANQRAVESGEKDDRSRDADGPKPIGYLLWDAE